MITKSYIQKKNENKLFIIIFLISLFLSNLGIPGAEDSRIMPNYFIAIYITFIAAKVANLNLYKLVMTSIIIDLFVGQLLGQYGLILISIYLIDFIIHKILIVKTELQIISLYILLILFSFFILGVTSASYDIPNPYKIMILQAILTFIVCLILRLIINKFKN